MIEVKAHEARDGFRPQLQPMSLFREPSFKWADFTIFSKCSLKVSFESKVTPRYLSEGDNTRGEP